MGTSKKRPGCHFVPFSICDSVSKRGTYTAPAPSYLMAVLSLGTEVRYSHSPPYLGKGSRQMFLKAKIPVGRKKKHFFTVKGGREAGREGGMHLGSVTHIQDVFSFQKKKITKRWIEEAVIHSNTKQCGEMNNTDAKRVQACFYTVYGTVSTCHSFCHNYSIKSLLVCTIQGFSSRIYSDLLLYLITGLLGVCIMVV